MKDPEFIELRNRFLFGLVVAIVFAASFFLLFFNRFKNSRANVLSALNQKETFFLLVREESCNICDTMEAELKKEKISYKVLEDRANEYPEVLTKLNLKESSIQIPTVIIIEDGKMSVNMVGMKTKKEFLSFLDVHSERIEKMKK